MGACDRLIAVHQAEQAPLAVEGLQYLGGGMVDLQTMLHRFRLVILADLHLTAAMIADTLDPCGVTDDVVRNTAFGAYPSTGHALGDLLIVNL